MLVERAEWSLRNEVNGTSACLIKNEWLCEWSLRNEHDHTTEKRPKKNGTEQSKNRDKPIKYAEFLTMNSRIVNP